MKIMLKIGEMKSPIDCVVNVSVATVPNVGLQRFIGPYKTAMKLRAPYGVLVDTRLRLSREKGVSIAAYIEHAMRNDFDGWKDLPETFQLFIVNRSTTYRASVQFRRVIGEEIISNPEDAQKAVYKYGVQAKVVEGGHESARPSEDQVIALPFDKIKKIASYQSNIILFTRMGRLHPMQLAPFILAIAAYYGYNQLEATREAKRLAQELAEQEELERIQRQILQERSNSCPAQLLGIQAEIATDKPLRQHRLQSLAIRDDHVIWTGVNWMQGNALQVLREYSATKAGTLSISTDQWNITEPFDWNSGNVVITQGGDVEAWYAKWQHLVRVRGGQLSLSSIQGIEGVKDYQIEYSYPNDEKTALKLLEAALQNIPCRIENLVADYNNMGKLNTISVMIRAFGKRQEIN